MFKPKTIVAILILFLLLLQTHLGIAQEEKPLNLTYQSSMIGIGGSSLFDTYLSPQKYTGTTIGLIYEQMKMSGMMQGNISTQQLFNVDFSWADNPTKTSSDYSGFLQYSYGLHYRLHPAERFQLFVGGQASGMLGFIYNNRNGNNPAAAKAHLNLNLSAIATYKLSIKKQPVMLRYQINTPFAGIMFSPHYGQSYYEISLGDNNNLMYFSSFHNNLALKNTISVEIPFSSTTIRLSYVNSIYETNINSLKTSIHSNCFFIGFSKNFFKVQDNKSINKNYRRVFE